ncbi:MAG TPA: mycofactocin biosynthesis glycosyltransferase MftF [Actinomycetota bacterium]|nr:mycofactocin biosynthesis glycosyltransferase MftF [Actinomycetota bacterium]
MPAPLPADFGVAIDPATRVEGEGAVLLGGDPFVVVRLGEDHAAAVRAWRRGEPAGREPQRARLARALVATNLAQPVPPARDPGLAVTAVVPVRDRPEQLQRLLAALAGTAEVAGVVVVDDASQDPGRTARVAGRAGARLLRRASRGGAAAARNDGAAAAGTPVVAFVDSDCVPRPGWLRSTLPHLADPRVAVVAPRIVARQGGSGLAGYERCRSPMDRGPAPASVRPGGRVPFLPGAALVARASALGAGFDTTLTGGEDVDLVWRLVRDGWHVRYEPAGSVEHEHRTRPGPWLARRAYYGRTAAPLERRHPGAARPLAISPWTAAAWAAAALGRPLAAGGITATAVALLARELGGVVPDPVGTAVALAGGGTVRSGWVVADAVTRTWWPLSLLAAALLPRLRLPLAAAALLPPALDWRKLRPPVDPLAWTALRLLDDLAYGWGVWSGCLRGRQAGPLLPDLGWRLSILSGEDLIDRYG